MWEKLSLPYLPGIIAQKEWQSKNSYDMTNVTFNLSDSTLTNLTLTLLEIPP